MHEERFVGGAFAEAPGGPVLFIYEAVARRWEALSPLGSSRVTLAGSLHWHGDSPRPRLRGCERTGATPNRGRMGDVTARFGVASAVTPPSYNSTYWTHRELLMTLLRLQHLVLGWARNPNSAGVCRGDVAVVAVVLGCPGRAAWYS